MEGLARSRESPLNAFVLAVITLVMVGPSFAFALQVSPWLAGIVLAVGAIALCGMLSVWRTRSTVWLWGTIGLSLIFGLGTIFSLGPGILLGALAMIAYAIAASRRLGIPAITWWGVLAECAGFCAPFLLFVL